MLQVLFRIPMTIGGFPLWSLLLVFGVGLGAGLWLMSRQMSPSALSESLAPVGRAVMVAAVAAAGGAYYFQGDLPKGVPVYGFGVMLCVAFFVCTWLAGRRGEREGITNETIQDLALVIFGGGLLGARICFLMMGDDRPQTVGDFLARLPRIWDGGIILYGSVVGAVLAYFLAYWLYFRRRGLQTRRLADAIAPCIAIGIGIGRLGCFLNGCCYGGILCAGAACAPEFTGAYFPMAAPPRDVMVQSGRQTAAGFTLVATGISTVSRVDPGSPAEKAGIVSGSTILSVNGRPVANTDDVIREFEAAKPNSNDLIELKLAVVSPTELQEQQVTLRVPVVSSASRLGSAGIGLRRTLTPIVEQVDPSSAAYRAGLEPGAVIVSVNDQPVQSGAALDRMLGYLAGWERGDTIVKLIIQPKDGGENKEIQFRPTTGPLYPTQIYEFISMALLMALLLAYERFRRNPGQVAALLMVCYGFHRFLNEILRDDDRPVGFERYGSLILVVGGVLLWSWLQWWKAVDPPVAPVGEAAKSLGLATAPAEQVAVAPGP